MSSRFINGATGDLYDKDSDACHFALQELGEVLKDIGFKVVKKLRRESTLRVYPRRIRCYPLLNPRFKPTTVHIDGARDTECLEITVISHSQGDPTDIDRHLQRFVSTPSCGFIRIGSHWKEYYYHGHFILPLQFISGKIGDEIDFESLNEPLQGLFLLLQGIPID